MSCSAAPTSGAIGRRTSPWGDVPSSRIIKNLTRDRRPRNVEGHHCRPAAFEQPEAGELKRQPEYDKGEEEWENVEVGLFREQPAHFRNGFEQLDHLLLEQASGIVSV